MDRDGRDIGLGEVSNELSPAIYLYWIPLGTDAQVVRASGKIFEGLSAFVQRRRPCDLYHTALEIVAPEGWFVVEMTPIPNLDGQRGVVGEGPVGLRWLGRFRLFRYELRCWRGGRIPDASEAIASPVKVAGDAETASRMLALARSVPTPVWGRDELRAGEMWNSNSVTSWLLERSGIDTTRIQQPAGGRAPGWSAGLVVAARQPTGASSNVAAAVA